MWSSSLLPTFSKKILWALLVLGIAFSQPALTKEKIHLFCPNVPRKEAILVAAFQAEKEVVFFEDVPGNVTLRQESVTFERALDLILQGTGILWHKKGDTYYIGTPKEGTPEYMALSDVEAYHSRFRTAQEILALHPEFVGKLLPVSPFHFLLAGPEKIREAMKKAIEEFDRPREHILVEAVLLEVQEGEGEDLAFSLPDVQPFSVLPHLEREEKLQGTLHSQKKQGHDSRRVTQKLLVLDGEWGEVWIGQRVYYKLEEETFRTLKTIELGTGIRARPVFLGNGRIRIDLGVTVADAKETDSLTVVRRTFSASPVLQEGEMVPVALVEEKREVARAQKLFENRTQGNRTPRREEEERNLVLLIKAKRERLENVPSLVQLEGPPVVVKKEERSSPSDVHAFLEYRTPGMLGIGFTASLGDKGSLTGSFYKELERPSFFGNLELSFPLEDSTSLKTRWEWTEKAQGLLLFFESQHNEYFFRIGGGETDSSSMAFVAFGGKLQKEAFSLTGTLTYQMDARNSNLRLDLEGQWKAHRNVFFVAGYSGILAGERTPFDDLRFEGFFVGLRVTF